MPLDSRALKAMRALFEWAWKNTPATRVVTKVPAFNRIALRFARRAGMTQFGINETSYRKNGTDHDQVLLGVTRPKGGPEQCRY